MFGYRLGIGLGMGHIWKYPPACVLRFSTYDNNNTYLLVFPYKGEFVYIFMPR